MLRPNIHHYRKQRGMTQAQLAARLGVSREHLSRLENNHAYLSEAMENRIALALDLSTEDWPTCFGYPGRTPDGYSTGGSIGLRPAGAPATDSNSKDGEEGRGR